MPGPSQENIIYVYKILKLTNHGTTAASEPVKMLELQKKKFNK
jgi:hypothetical protein